jgi:tRNA(fMet)-specific endonuclease VapC
MKYLLDTNTCIAYLNGSNANVLQHMQRLKPIDIALCSVVKSELWYGAMKSQAPTQTLTKLFVFFNQFASLPFNDRAARESARIRADLAKRGTPIGPYDVQIAGIATLHTLKVIINNVGEFRRVVGLQLENWHEA